MTNNKVVQILMKRDGMTEDEAIELLAEVKEMIEDCLYDPEETSLIIAEELNLEPDYIFDILDLL